MCIRPCALVSRSSCWSIPTPASGPCLQRGSATLPQTHTPKRTWAPYNVRAWRACVRAQLALPGPGAGALPPVCHEQQHPRRCSRTLQEPVQHRAQLSQGTPPSLSLSLAKRARGHIGGGGGGWWWSLVVQSSEEKDEAPLQVLLSLPAGRVLRYEQYLKVGRRAAPPLRPQSQIQ